MKKIFGFTAIAIILLAFFVALVWQIEFEKKGGGQVAVRVERSEPSGDVGKIKQTIESYWNYSRDNDPRRLDFVTFYPKSFESGCRKKPRDAPSERKKNFRDGLVEQDDKVERMTTAPDILEILSTHIREDGWEIRSYNEFIVNGDEAIAYIGYTGFSSVGFFLTKEEDGEWRIFRVVPKSVVDRDAELRNYASAGKCGEEL